MTDTAQLRAPETRAEEDYRATMLAFLRSILKRRIITLYCLGFFDIRHTQYLVDRFGLWGH